VTCLCAGGNTGIGKATALQLAGLGARVVLACRNQDKAREAARHIQQVLSLYYYNIITVQLESTHLTVELCVQPGTDCCATIILLDTILLYYY